MIPLEEIVLNCNSLGDVGGKFIGEALLVSRLKKLFMRDCDIALETAKAISDSIAKRPDSPLQFLDLNLNDFSLESELALNDVGLGNSEVTVLWREPGSRRQFEQEEVEAIIEHYDANHILHNLLVGDNLLPLIEDSVILGHMEVDDEAMLSSFIEDAFFTEEETPEQTEFKYTKGLEMLIHMLWRGEEPKTFLHDDFDLVDVEDLGIPLVSSSTNLSPKLIPLIVRRANAHAKRVSVRMHSCLCGTFRSPGTGKSYPFKGPPILMALSR